MKRIIMYAIANIIKSKGHTISFLLLILLAMTMMTVGVVAYTDCSENFDRHSTELNSGDGLFAIESKMYSQNMYDDISNNDKVTDCELRDIKLCNTTCKFADGTEILRMVIWKKSDKCRINKTHYFEGEDDNSANGVYLPLLYKTGGGYKLGDEFKITVGDKVFKYTVSGFVENTFLGSTNMPAIGMILDDDSYKKFTEETEGRYDAKMINFVMKSHDDATKFASDIFSKYSQIDGKDYECIRMYYNGSKSSMTFMAQICSVFVVLFAMVILAIAVMLIRFRIINSIEDDIKSIGALKAIGYTSSELIISYIFQFVIIAAGGIILGGISAKLVLPFLAKALETQSGMAWEICMAPSVIVILTLILLILIILTVMVAAGRIKKLTAIAALHNGFSTHNFKKNHFAFIKTRGSATMIFSLKNIMAHIRQNIMICCIAALLTFVSVFVYSIYYNMAVDNEAFVSVVAGEVPSANITLNDEGRSCDMLSEIKKDSRVRKAIYWTTQSLNFDGRSFYSYIVDDFNELDSNLCFKGRSPSHDNEIALGGFGADELGKDVGDEITLSLGDHKKTYMITGLIQTGNNMGYDAEMTTAGIKRLVKEWKHEGLYIYLNDDVDCDKYIVDVKNDYADKVKIAASIEKLLEAQMGSYKMITKLLATVIVIMSSLIIGLILLLILKTMINKEKRGLGIQKAMGYTSRQLMFQVGFTMIPVIVIGTVIGIVMGAFFTNPLCSVMLKSLGIMRMDLKIIMSHFMIIGMAFVVFSFVFAMIISLRIRKISACSLIQE